MIPTDLQFEIDFHDKMKNLTCFQRIKFWYSMRKL